MWRLYYQGARSVSEQFFEVDLAAILNVPGHNDGLFALDEAERRHGLKLFALVFGRDAFMAGAADERTFHRRAIEEGRYYEERVADNLSKLVFEQVFPGLARAIAAAAPDARLSEVREAALILLYRLLFILYAEDRDLLPVRDERYDDYALRDRCARRCRPPQGPGGYVRGNPDDLLVGGRRSLPRHRPGRSIHRPAALQRRAVR